MCFKLASSASKDPSARFVRAVRKPADSTAITTSSADVGAVPACESTSTIVTEVAGARPSVVTVIIASRRSIVAAVGIQSAAVGLSEKPRFEVF